MFRLQPRGWCVLVLVVAIAALHCATLFGGRVYHMDDAADGYYPAHVAIARAWKEGHLPTWERGSWSGWPINVDPYYGPFYPPSLIFSIAPVAGLAWTIALHMMAAALGMLWLLRRRKLDWGPALFGAVSFGLSSFMIERIRHIIFAEGMAWLPFVLVGVEGWLQTKRPRELALIALSAGMMVLCGALPLVPYFVLIVLAYLVPRWWQGDKSSAIGLGLAGVIGGLVACAQIIPTMAHVPLSPRALSTDYHFAASYAWPELRYLGLLFAPDFLGGEDKGGWFGVYNYWEMAGFYAGALALGLLVVGLFRRKAEHFALLFVALLGVILAFGDKTPLHKWFFDYVPLFGTLRCPTRGLIMLIFTSSLVGAEGLQLLEERISPSKMRAIGFALVSLGLLMGFTLLLRHKPRILPADLAVRQGFAHLFAVLAVAAIVFSGWCAGFIKPEKATLVLALVALADVISVDAMHLQPRPGDWAQGTDKFQAVDWLIQQHPHDRFIPASNGPFRLHNVGMTYGLESAGGYDSVSVWRYVELLQIINTGAPYPHKKLLDDLAAGVIKRFGSPLIDLLNIRYAIAPQPPAPEWIERFAPSGPPHAVHEPTWDPQLRVYENPHVLPRAFVVYQSEVLADSAKRMVTLDPKKIAIIDHGPSLKEDRPLTPAKITVAERQRILIDAEAAAPGILVLSETWYPGWSAFVDGKPADLLRADHALRGLFLEAGHHTVEMRFSSRPTQLGLLLSLLGLVGVAGLLFRRRVVP
jgi:hypothetical protein